MSEGIIKNLELIIHSNKIASFYKGSFNILSQIETQKVFYSIAQEAAKLLACQGSILAIAEEKTKLTRVVALYNLPFEYEELVLKPGVSVASRVLVTGEPVILNGLKEDGITDSYDAILSVPLIQQGEILGALTVVDQLAKRNFTNHDTQLLSALAESAIIALNNANFHSKAVQANQSLKKEIKDKENRLNKVQERLATKTKQLQLLLGSTVFLQEEERAQIARDLHDGPNQLLTGTLYEIQAAQTGLSNEKVPAVIAGLDRAKELLRQIAAENRRIASGLRPAILDVDGLIPAIEKLADTFQQYSGSTCSLQIEGESKRLEPHTETTIYRIAQEALNNAAAYAKARKVKIIINFQQDLLTVTVEDDGIGFDYDKPADKDRMGLIGMKERAKSLGGRLRVHSQAGEGTQVVLHLPLPALPPPQVRYHGFLKQTGSLLEAGEEQVSSMNNETQEKIRWVTGGLGGEKTRTQGQQITSRDQKEQVETILKNIATAVKNIENEQALALVKKAIKKQIDPMLILNNGVLMGVKAIGELFETRYYFLGELLTGAKLAESCIAFLDPYLPKGSTSKKGVIVIGTVKGDLHSIGSGLVVHQLKLAGYQVHDMGINVAAMDFIDKAQAVGADIIGLSAFLSSTLPYLEEVMNYLKDMGLKKQFKVIIGGAETSRNLANKIGADGWAPTAVEAVKLCDRLMGYGTYVPGNDPNKPF